MNPELYRKLKSAYIDSRMMNEPAKDEIVFDIFVFEAEFLLCAVALLASFATEDPTIIPFTHLDMKFMSQVNVGQINDFCNVFADLKKSQLAEINTALSSRENGSN